jgi:hypothetical protein
MAQRAKIKGVITVQAFPSKIFLMPVTSWLLTGIIDHLGESEAATK